MNYRDSDLIEAVNRQRRSTRAYFLGVVCVALIVLAFVWTPAHATDATLRWEAPTQFTDDKPIPANTVITYDIFLDGAKINGGIKLLAFFVGGYTSPTGCFTIRAIIAEVSSADSGQMCKPSEPPSKKSKPPVLKSAT